MYILQVIERVYLDERVLIEEMEEELFLDVPPRLRPTISEIRSGQKYTYPNLAKVRLSLEEREWLVQECLGETANRPDQVRRQCDLETLQPLFHVL